jgi:hypothetical protein
MNESPFLLSLRVRLSLRILVSENAGVPTLIAGGQEQRSPRQRKAGNGHTLALA